jgi:hypothetical protein
MNAWGYLYGGIDVRHEADQQFKEQNFNIGLEAGYINPRDVNIWSFIPSVIMALELVDPFRSELRDDLNADDEMYARLRIEASLKSSFGRLFFQETRLAPLGLRFDFRYYKSYGLPERVEDADQEEALYLAGAVTYTMDHAWGVFDHLMVFLRISDGRIPPLTDDETIVTLGALMPLGR